MLTTTLMLSYLLASEVQAEIGTCDPPDGPRIQWTEEQRHESRARARFACKQQKAAPVICDEFLDAVGYRESSWRPGIRHTLGANENGIGLLGINKRWHRDKWPGALEPAMCRPEPSVLVFLDVVRRAQRNWGAKNLRDVNAVYAGRFRCVREVDGTRECWIVRNAKKDRDICARLEARGVDCMAPLRERVAGRYVPVRDRPRVAEEIAAKWAARSAT